MDPLTTAQIAWGFLADPGDPLARALCEAWGPEKALGLVTGSGTSAAVFAGLGRASHPLDGSHLRHWRARYHPDEVARSYHLQQRAGIEVLDSSHRAWPTTMNDLGPSAPLSLWVRGNPTIWAAHPVSLAVVGSRRPTGAGLGHTTSIVQGAWCDTVAIVSGGATGIDTVAHHAALVHDRVPLVVLAGGLDAVYPAENVALMNRIAERGALYSEAPCGMRVKPESFGPKPTYRRTRKRRSGGGGCAPLWGHQHGLSRGGVGKRSGGCPRSLGGPARQGVFSVSPGPGGSHPHGGRRCAPPTSRAPRSSRLNLEHGHFWTTSTR